ncbi:MAG: hypothetical protein AAGC49_03450 [Brevundimonas sp.]
MATEETDDQPFFGVPKAMLCEFGKLAVLSARIERAAYEIARTLGLPPPNHGRTNALRQECGHILKRLKDPSLPGRFDGLVPGWRERVREWVDGVPDIVDGTRNLYLHAYYMYARDSENTERSGDSRDPTDIISVSLDDVRAALDKLKPWEAAGEKLRRDVSAATAQARAVIHDLEIPDD